MAWIDEMNGHELPVSQGLESGALSAAEPHRSARWPIGRPLICEECDEKGLGCRAREENVRSTGSTARLRRHRALQTPVFLGSSTAEHPAVNMRVAGSNPARGANFRKFSNPAGTIWGQSVGPIG